ncbi:MULTISPECIES: MbnP family protein [unclassified Leisingera]|uniref:MbnP family protein n=1 Tax=unclassified Leisingera TaxID=2614906 RepID=UPI0002FD255F|nr:MULTISPECIES: MbnP family protein [unclassified Leisingera]
MSGMKPIHINVLLAFLLALTVWHAFRKTDPPASQLRLVFQAEANGQKLVFDQFHYKNPNGPGQFRVQNFRFYISNIKLSGEDGTYLEPDSYHLVRFGAGNESFAVELNNIPLRSYSGLSFSIGIDEQANASIEPRGDLDPNSQMAWNWEVGYKFVVFEGSLILDDAILPLVYHLGFDENRRDLQFSLPAEEQLSSTSAKNFKVDVMELFSGASAFNMAQTQSVKFDRQDARRLAENYAGMISIAGN